MLTPKRKSKKEMTNEAQEAQESLRLVMPFKSKSQARFMFAKHPGIAKEFASKTESIKALPEKIGLKEAMMKRKIKGGK